MLNDAIEYSYANLFFIAKYIYNKKIDKELQYAHMTYSGEEYISFVLAVSMIAFTFSLLGIFLTKFWFPISILVFTFSYALLSYYPKMRSKKIARDIEREIPEFLRKLSIELGSGVSFEEIIENSSKGNSELDKELRKASIEIRKGSSLPKALSNMCLRNKSKKLNNSISLIIGVYQKSSNKASESISKLARDFSKQEQVLLKEYYGKAAVYSLIFITFSAVLPAMYQAFVIIGSRFLKLGISPDQALFVPVLVFPLINLIIIFSIMSRRP